MYSVSNAFKEKMRSPIQEHRITGTIGSVPFSEANIVEGSFSISNQSTDTNDVVLGSCYVGQLTCEFTGIEIEWGKWINKTITPTFALNLGNNTWEDVPLGIFKVKEAKHTDHGVQVTAYDNMIKFDRKFVKSHYMNISGMYNIITMLCTDANVTLGMTQAQIEALPNGSRSGINIYGSRGKKADFANDITTLRDLLFWVAQTLGCFATINRAGQLEFRQYTQDVVDNISNVHRIEGATFADYITHYVGIYVENLDDNTEDYYGYDTTALQQEFTETMAEITEDQADYTDLELDRADWVQKLANHECTQQEYDAAIAEIDAAEKALTKEINQLSKRAEWLSDAIAQSAEDGSDMVLGANPLTMAKNLTTRDAQRREILGALNAISYTPFQASVLCGCIYDLGDVIQFSGGLYNSDTDSFGCVMSYTYTHNGGTELEGFGVDPSVVVVRNKTQKSTDRASKNAVNAKESFNGYDTPDVEFPTGGKDGDIYIKRATHTSKTSKYRLSYDGRYFGNGSRGNGITLTTVDMNDDGYFDFGMGGIAYPADYGGYRNFENGAVIYKAKLNGAGRYRWHCKIKAKWDERNSATAWAKIGFAMATGDEQVSQCIEAMPMGHNATSANGFALNLSDTQNQFIEYSATINISDGMLTDDYIYIWFMFNGVIPIANDNFRKISLQVEDFYYEKQIDTSTYDGGVNTNVEEYIDKVYTYIVDENTGTGSWVDIEYVAGVQGGDWDGIKLNYKRFAALKNYVMRAWYKADPPQTPRDFAQFCARYTGTPDKAISIAAGGGTTWHNSKIVKDDDNVFKIKCKGTYAAGNINYVAYQLSGLESGTEYYFNFKCAYSGNPVFNMDTSMGCGIVFNTSGELSTGMWVGEPDTFDETTKYYAFKRETSSWYADFHFTANAQTMYACIIMQAETGNTECGVTLSEMVISQNERSLIRGIYLYDYEKNVWLKYKPFSGSTSGGDEGGSVVTISPTVSTGTKIADFSIDGVPGELYAPGGSEIEPNPPATATEDLSKVKIDDTVYDIIDTHAVRLTDVGTPYGVAELDANGKVPSGQLPSYVDDVEEYASLSNFPATGESGKIYLALDTNLCYRWSGSEYVEISPSLALGETSSTAYRGDRGKIAYDHSQTSGNPHGTDLSELDDVAISGATSGQVLKYNGSGWVNDDESGGLFTVVDGKVCITYET